MPQLDVFVLSEAKYLKCFTNILTKWTFMWHNQTSCRFLPIKMISREPCGVFLTFFLCIFQRVSCWCGWKTVSSSLFPIRWWETRNATPWNRNPTGINLSFHSPPRKMLETTLAKSHLTNRRISTIASRLEVGNI